MVLVIGLVIGWRWTEDRLFRYVGTAHPVVVTPERVILADAPAWMSQAVRTRIASVASEWVSSDPLDGQSLQMTVKALQQEAWVRRVDQVRRLNDGYMEVRAAFRRPIAIVASRVGYHLVDEQGVRLPGLYTQIQTERLGLPVITGVSSPPRRVGQPWPGKDLQAGLALAMLLGPEPYANQIKTFDVSHRDVRGRIRPVLYTERGMIHWGFPPGQERSIEPAATVKRRRLRQVAALRKGAIDAGGQIVSVYGPVIQTRPREFANDRPQTGYTFERR